MARTLDDIINALPPDERARVEARAEELMAEVESLGALRRLADQTQEQIAESLRISQPSVSKIERQTDLYLSTLRRFVEAAGGTLEIRVEFPGKPPLRLTGLGAISD